MTITLSPQHEEAIARAMQSGGYQSPEQVIARALELLQAEDEWLVEHRGEIAAKIDRACEQFERGEYFEEDEAEAELDRRKAAWLSKRQS